MPELPEVETVRRTLQRQLKGARMVSVRVPEARLRWPVDPKRLSHHCQGATVLRVRRRGKYLLVDLEHTAHPSGVLLVHLGMTGHLGVVPADHPRVKHTHVIWQLADGRELRYTDPRRFGMIDAFLGAEEPRHPRLRGLGLEPLGEDFVGERLWQMARGRKVPIKSYLMNATQIVGVGNIYASEALFAAGIHPGVPAGKISKERWERLCANIKAILEASIGRGGTTFRDFRDAEGHAGAFAQSLSVYGREGERCRRCPKTIRRAVTGARSTFFCPGCQRR